MASTKRRIGDADCDEVGASIHKKIGCHWDTYMKFTKTVKQAGVAQFLVNKNINLNEFRSLMIEVASTLSSTVEWIAMSEAKIGTIKLSTGRIYAKFDFAYGLEFDCEGCMDHDIFQIETTLSKKTENRNVTWLCPRKCGVVRGIVALDLQQNNMWNGIKRAH